MALNFPTEPNIDDTYTVGSKTWRWNGLSWVIISALPTGSALPVLKNSTQVSARHSLNLIEGTNIALTVTDGGGGPDMINVTIAASGTDPAAAYGQANLARDGANTAYVHANNAYNSSNTVLVTAQGAFSAANAAASEASIARGKANTACTQSDQAGTNANNAYGAANTAYIHANNAYNSSNTVLVTAQGAFTAANSASSEASIARGKANTACTQSDQAGTNANNAYGAANTAYIHANNAYNSSNTVLVTAQAAFGGANSATITASAAFAKANLACTQSDAAGTQANAAFTKANVANNMRVMKDATAVGARETLNFIQGSGVTLTIEDGGAGPNMINISIAAAAGGGNVSSFAPTQTDNIAVFLGTDGLTIQDSLIKVGTITGAFAKANLACTQSDSAGTQANAAFAAANTAYVHANNAYNSSNTVLITAQGAFGAANSAASEAVIARDKANTACTQSDQAGTQANNAYGSSNNVLVTTQSAFGKANNANLLASIASITFVIDGGGAAITGGFKGDLEIPFNCTILGWKLLADQSGSLTLDVLRRAYSTGYPPEAANNLVGGAGTSMAQLNSQAANDSITLTDWTTTISAGDILRFNVNTVSTITRTTLALRVLKT